MKTGVPSGTRANSAIMSGSEARRQPCESAPPTEPGVPWIAMRLPPIHPEGSSVIDETTGEMRANWEIALEMADRLRSNAVAAVPSTMAETGLGETSNTQRAWDFKFLETPSEALKIFDERFNYLNVMKLRSVWVPEQGWIGWVGLFCLWSAAGLTAVTGWDYLRVGLKHMD